MGRGKHSLAAARRRAQAERDVDEDRVKQLAESQRIAHDGAIALEQLAVAERTIRDLRADLVARTDDRVRNLRSRLWEARARIEKLENGSQVFAKTLRFMARNEGKLPMDRWRQVADALGVSVEDLVHDLGSGGGSKTSTASAMRGGRAPAQRAGG